MKRDIGDLALFGGPDLTGVRNCVATCNATMALQLLVRAAHLSDEVITLDAFEDTIRHNRKVMALTPIGSPACHQLEPYRSGRPVRLPHTERLVPRIISLPSGSAVIRFALARSTDVVARHRQGRPSRQEPPTR